MNLDIATSTIYDISPVIDSTLAVFPGDVPFSRNILLSQDHNDHLDLSSMNTSLHIGAHADAPSHYGKGAATIEARDLKLYMGSCQVVEVKLDPGQRITLKDFDVEQIVCPRVLFKTSSFDPYSWSEGFNSLSPEVIMALANKNVVLVGIDTPSVDPHDSKLLESHKTILKCDLAILEGLVLDQVPVGQYQLVALPLRIKDADASPVRAILFC